MKHLGDITKIHGDKIEPVDCITFGSPCQGLSMAGKRLGFDDNRSVLFLDAARIIKDASKETGVSVSQISCCAKGQKKSCKGYEFQRIEEFPMAVTKRRFGEE